MRNGEKDFYFLANELNPDLTPEEDAGGEENRDNVTELGTTTVPKLTSDIHVLTVIGQVEGHLVMPPQNKTTKYEHVIPQLIAVEENPDIKGLLIILNTVGGDVEAGLALAEMIATMAKPTVSLVLGGGHSIGIPIAVSAKQSFIAPTATMTIHPVRLTGLVLGVPQSFDYLQRMQDRVVGFITSHSHIDAATFRKLMMTTGELAQDVGTVVVGEDAVSCGLMDAVGGVGDALAALRQMIAQQEVSPKEVH